MKVGDLTLTRIAVICRERTTCEDCPVAMEYNDYNKTPSTCCLLHHKYPEIWDETFLEKELGKGDKA